MNNIKAKYSEIGLKQTKCGLYECIGNGVYFFGFKTPCNTKRRMAGHTDQTQLNWSQVFLLMSFDSVVQSVKNNVFFRTGIIIVQTSGLMIQAGISKVEHTDLPIILLSETIAGQPRDMQVISKLYIIPYWQFPYLNISKPPATRFMKSMFEKTAYRSGTADLFISTYQIFP